MKTNCFDTPQKCCLVSFILFQILCMREETVCLALMLVRNLTLPPRHKEHDASTDETAVERPASHLFNGGERSLHLHLSLQ